jgi:small subunit ribosomal protein S6
VAKHVYEAMFIFDSNRFGRDPGGVSGAIATMAQKFGGEILASRLWEERRLAYPINGQRKGTYWLTYLRLESKELVNLNREIALNESIMRSLVLKVDPRIVDALVSHATQGPTAAPAPAAAPRREAVAASTEEAAAE